MPLLWSGTVIIDKVTNLICHMQKKQNHYASVMEWDYNNRQKN